MPNLDPEFRWASTDPKRYSNAPHYQKAPLPPSGFRFECFEGSGGKYCRLSFRLQLRRA